MWLSRKIRVENRFPAAYGAIKAVGPEEALESLTDLVQRVQNLVHPDQ